VTSFEKQYVSRISRQDLYEQVWSQPITKLAEKDGLSYMGLRNKCKKLDIPLPPIGYWVKKQFGKASPRPPLPSFEGASDVTFEIGNRKDRLIEKEKFSEAQERIAFEKLNDNQVHVLDRLTSPHLLIRQAGDILRSSKLYFADHDLLNPGGETCLDIRVSKASLGRALRIMNALIIALEKRGFKVSVTAKEPYAQYTSYITQATVLGESLEFSLREKLSQISHQPTKDELGRFSIYPKYDYIPSGRLSLTLAEYVGDNIRRTWADGKRQRLEDCINEVIIGLIEAAVAKREWELQREEKRRERREEEFRREEEARRKREEEERVQSLINQAENWNKSRLIREYIEAVREAAVRKNGGMEPNSRLSEWFTWARRQADELDPLA
jgi:hypothetical protein